MARKGTPISTAVFMGLFDDPTLRATGVFTLPTEGRIRAWRLPEGFDATAARLRGWGLSERGDSLGVVNEGGAYTHSIHLRQFRDEATEARVALLEGTSLPEGSRCAMLVQEATGVRADWRRCVARLRRVGRP